MGSADKDLVWEGGLILLLFHGGKKTSVGMEDVVSADKGFGMGRSKHASVRDLFQVGGTGRYYRWT